MCFAIGSTVAARRAVPAHPGNSRKRHYTPVVIGLRRRPLSAPVRATGVARVDQRTKRLIKRTRAGDIAVIDHEDLDRLAAEGLIRAGVVAVVNASTSISGRYPNIGPLLLLDAGVVLIDAAGKEVLDAVTEGDQIRVDGSEILRDGQVVGRGNRLTRQAVEEAMAAADESIGVEIQRFATNTLEYVRKEAPLLFSKLSLPPLHTHFSGRHALVVVRGYDYKRDLAALRSYVREFRPALIGVDGGADALLEVGLRPDVIIGDFDSVSREAVDCGADLVHHVHPGGHAPGKEQLLEWGLPYVEFVAEGTSEDVAMLLAYEAGAELIVAVGTHGTMVEFLDKGRAGMASTFLTQLRLGPIVVDAKGVSKLYQGRIRRRDIAMLVGSALLAVLVMVLVSESLQVFLDGARLQIRDLWYAVTDKTS